MCTHAQPNLGQPFHTRDGTKNNLRDLTITRLIRTLIVVDNFFSICVQLVSGDSVPRVAGTMRSTKAIPGARWRSSIRAWTACSVAFLLSAAALAAAENVNVLVMIIDFADIPAPADRKRRPVGNRPGVLGRDYFLRRHSDQSRLGRNLPRVLRELLHGARRGLDDLLGHRPEVHSDRPRRHRSDQYASGHLPHRCHAWDLQH